MLDGEVVRQVGKLIGDGDRRMLQYAVTEEYLDALAQAAAADVKGAATRKPRDGGRRRAQWRSTGAGFDAGLEGGV